MVDGSQAACDDVLLGLHNYHNSIVYRPTESFSVPSTLLTLLLAYLLSSVLWHLYLLDCGNTGQAISHSSEGLVDRLLL